MAAVVLTSNAIYAPRRFAVVSDSQPQVIFCCVRRTKLGKRFRVERSAEELARVVHGPRAWRQSLKFTCRGILYPHPVRRQYLFRHLLSFAMQDSL